MARIGSKLNSGFVATPLIEGEYISKLITTKGDGNWLDPTCGEGKILKFLKENFNVSIETYGVELDATRYEIASEYLDVVVNAPIEQMAITPRAFSLLFLNPPYDTNIGGGRKEVEMLQKSFPWLMGGGLLVYIVPSHVFADETLAKYLSVRFKNIGLFRFSDANFDNYKQVVFIGNKATGKVQFNKKLYQFLLQMKCLDFVKRKVTSLDKVENILKAKGEPFSIPQSKIEVKSFFSKIEGKENYYKMRESKGFQVLQNILNPRDIKITDTPILPINQGQMGLILPCGGVNGLVGEGDTLHTIQGLEVVSERKRNEYNTGKDGTVYVTEKLTTNREAKIKVITPLGVKSFGSKDAAS